MHPATLMASTAAATALLLSTPLTLQAHRAGEAERRLADVMAAGPASSASRKPSVAAPARPAALAPGPVAVSAKADTATISRTDSQRKAEARAHAEKVVADDEAKIMSRLNERFSLSPHQEKAIAAWHGQQRELRCAYLEKRRLREPYDPAFFAVEYGYHPDIPPRLESVLDASQQKRYVDWEQERRTNYVEGWSGAELSFLADPLELTAEQKDLIFAGLHTIWSDYSAEDLTRLRTAEDIAARMDANHQTRRDAFAPILMPEQLPKWEKLSLDFNRDLVRRYQPAPAGAPTDASPNVP